MSFLPTDPFSSSPVLLDILNQLSHSDVLNCKLINRRIYEVIKNNDLYKPRKVVDIAIIIEERYVEVSIRPKGGIFSDIWMTESCVEVTVYKQLDPDTATYKYFQIDSLFQHISQNGAPIDGEILNRHAGILGAATSRTKEWDTFQFSANGLLESVNMLLSFVFREFHVKFMSISTDIYTLVDMSDRCVSLISDIFLQQRCLCRYLTLQQVPPRCMAGLLSNLGYPGTDAHMLDYEMFLEYMRELKHWKGRHSVLVPRYFRTMQPLLQIIENWSNGVHGMPEEVEFYQVGMRVFHWTPEEVTDAFRQFKGFRLWYNDLLGRKEILITGDTGETMGIQYSKKDQYFCMRIVKRKSTFFLQ